MLFLQQLGGGPGIFGQVDVIMILEGSAKAFALRFLIVHYEQSWGHYSRRLRVAISSVQVNKPAQLKQLAFCIYPGPEAVPARAPCGCPFPFG